jgi:hypothetical protein
MPPKRQSLGSGSAAATAAAAASVKSTAVVAAASAAAASSAAASAAPSAALTVVGSTPSLADDPVAIHSDEQLTHMQKLLMDHVRAVKTDAAGRALTVAQRKFLIDHVRTEFAASVFAKVCIRNSWNV